jgi:hypothetical protein
MISEEITTKATIFDAFFHQLLTLLKKIKIKWRVEQICKGIGKNLFQTFLMKTIRERTGTMLSPLLSCIIVGKRNENSANFF